jgi:hypothetical protein
MASIKKLSALIMGAAVFTAISAPAEAITLTFGGTPVAGQGQFSSVPGVTTIDFESGAPTSGLAVYSAPGPGPAVVSGNTPGVSIISADDNTRYLAVSIFGDARGTTPVTIAFANPLDYFGLYWGTPSANNTISFFNGNTLLQSFSGDALYSVTPSTGAAYANFFADAGESFNKVVLSEISVAFESDNHAYKVASEPVPEPLTSLTAFASVVTGVLMKRQQQRKGVDRSDR